MKAWQRYLKSMVEIEEEHVAEDYRAGRGLNDTDEKDNAVIRREFAELKAAMPMILAAQQMLDALREAKAELIDLYSAAYPDDEGDNDTTAVIDKVIAVIAKARKAGE
jgi:hypothetical protein